VHFDVASSPGGIVEHRAARLGDSEDPRLRVFQ
jgi:hypothetical protein